MEIKNMVIMVSVLILIETFNIQFLLFENCRENPIVAGRGNTQNTEIK